MERDESSLIHEKVLECELLLKALKDKSLRIKLQFLQSYGPVDIFLKGNPALNDLIKILPGNEQLLFFALIAIGQGHLFSEKALTGELVIAMMKSLGKIDDFYQEIGGIIGYQKTVLKLLEEAEHPTIPKNISFSTPSFIDICKRDKKTKEMIALGLKKLNKVGFILPMGGAGDRLGLIDEKSQKPLPAAKLPFLGKNLIELIIRDIAALEYLYHKTYGWQHICPIVIMTSLEKDNHSEILNIFKEQKWFGRGRESFFFIQQISVPMVTKNGNWIAEDSGRLLLKPGGHGVLWKLMQDSKAFEWLKKRGAGAAVVRQINNPVAFTDHNLLALAGFGLSLKKAMGFASCPRAVNSAEGMNILKEVKQGKKKSFAISNIEYTDFKRLGIEDTPIYPNSPYSKYPSNTNILFVDLKKIKSEVQKNSFPGQTINMKNRIGQEEAGRLELMMQNIADGLVSAKCSEKELQSFLTYNERSKTLSCTKKSYLPGCALLETPEGCFFDILRNSYELLKDFCKMKLPPLPREADFTRRGPSFIALFHPALGPLFDLIGQKIRHGELKKSSELQLEIAEAFLEKVIIDGSLLIKASCVMGSVNPLFYGRKMGRCTLRKVKISNPGIDWLADNIFWQNRIKRKGALELLLMGDSEFVAENVHFKKPYLIRVPDGRRIIAYEKAGEVKFLSEPL